MGLSHLLGERGASRVEAHLCMLWGLGATGGALWGVHVKWRVALTAASGGACQGPVDRNEGVSAASRSSPHGLHANLSLYAQASPEIAVAFCSSKGQSPPQALFY